MHCIFTKKNQYKNHKLYFYKIFFTTHICRKHVPTRVRKHAPTRVRKHVPTRVPEEAWTASSCINQ